MHPEDLAFYRELEAEARVAFPVGTRVFVKPSHPWGGRDGIVVNPPTFTVSRIGEGAVHARVRLDEGGTVGAQPRDMAKISG